MPTSSIRGTMNASTTSDANASVGITQDQRSSVGYGFDNSHNLDIQAITAQNIQADNTNRNTGNVEAVSNIPLPSFIATPASETQPDDVAIQARVQQTIQFNKYGPKGYNQILTTMLEEGDSFSDLPQDMQSEVGRVPFATYALKRFNKARPDATQAERVQYLDDIGLPHLFKEQDFMKRFQSGMSSTLAEIIQDDQAEDKYIKKQRASKLFDAYTNGDFDLATAIGEGIPAMTYEAVVGLLTKGRASTGLAVGGGSAIIGSEYQGSKDFDANAGTQAVLEVAGGVLGYTAGHYISKGLSKYYGAKELPEQLNEARAVADKLGIKLYNIDGTLNETSLQTFRAQLNDYDVFSQGRLAHGTKEGMETLLSHLEDINKVVSKLGKDPQFTADAIGRNLRRNKLGEYLTYKHYYKKSNEFLEQSNSFGTTPDYLDTLKVTTDRPEIRKQVTNYMNMLKKEYDGNLMPKDILGLIKTFGSKSRDAYNKQGGATLGSAYQQVTEQLKKKLEVMVPNNDALKSANKGFASYQELYNDKSGTVTKFLNKLDSDPVKAIKNLDYKTFKGIQSSIDPETRLMLAKYKFNQFIDASTTKGKFSPAKFADAVEAMPKDFKQALFTDIRLGTPRGNGVDIPEGVTADFTMAQHLTNLAELAKVLGRREFVSDKEGVPTAFYKKYFEGSVGFMLPFKVILGELRGLVKSPRIRKAIQEKFPKEFLGAENTTIKSERLWPTSEIAGKVDDIL